MLVDNGIDNHCSKLTGRRGRTPRLKCLVAVKAEVIEKMALK